MVDVRFVYFSGMFDCIFRIMSEISDFMFRIVILKMYTWRDTFT